MRKVFVTIKRVHTQLVVARDLDNQSRVADPLNNRPFRLPLSYMDCGMKYFEVETLRRFCLGQELMESELVRQYDCTSWTMPVHLVERNLVIPRVEDHIQREADSVGLEQLTKFRNVDVACQSWIEAEGKRHRVA